MSSRVWAFWKFHGTMTINLNLALSLRACAGEQAGVPESGTFHWVFTRPPSQAVGCVVGGLWQSGLAVIYVAMAPAKILTRAYHPRIHVCPHPPGGW